MARASTPVNGAVAHSHARRVTVGGGLPVWQVPVSQALSVSVGVWVRAGGRFEPGAHSGISHFLEHLVFKGTRRRGCEQLKQAIEGVGGSLNGFTAEEFTCYMAKVPRRYARRAVGILAEMLTEPTLARKDVERERGVILEEIRMYEDSPGQYVQDLLHELLWPSHPLGRLLSGTADTVKAISRESLVAYWRRMYHPGHITVTLVGAPEAIALEGPLAQAFGRLPARTPARFAPAPRPRRRPQARVWRKATEQTHLCLGMFAMPRTHPDRFALELLHVILGANMSSRLFREVREKRGLAYEIGTHIKRFHDTGAFVVSAGCDPGKLHETLRTIGRELTRIRREPVTQAELRRAKDYDAGQLIMGLEDTMDHMLWIGEQAVTVGRPAPLDALLGRLEAVTAADIRRVARQVLDPARMHLAVMGPVEPAEAPNLLELCDGR